MRTLVVSLSIAIALLVGIVGVRTARFRPPPIVVEPSPSIAIRDGAAARLAGSIRFATVSHADPAAIDVEAFRGLHAYLARTFPQAHARLRREKIGAHSLLYTWPGRDTTLKPILLLGHQDVVPVEPGTEGSWTQEPFAGRVADGFVWGRGAIDNKSAVVGTLEAVEMLLAEGFRPARTVYLAFGHDEEVGGRGGAKEVADVLKRRGVSLEFMLDEGGVIGDGVLPGVSAPTALVGIAEKGFVSVELTTRGSGGHSSLPPLRSPIGKLGAAIARLEENQMPARFTEPTHQLFDRTAPHFPLTQRVAFANTWLTRPLLLKRLQQSDATNAMVRTTTAVTVFQAGTKDNVLASSARAVINFRILQGDGVASVVEHVRRVVNDTSIHVTVVGFTAEPSDVSSTESESYRALERSIRAVAPDAIVAPYLVVVVTDARHYSSLSRNVYRFLPLRLKSEDLARIHGTNERMSVADYEVAIRLYRQVIVNAAGQPRAGLATSAASR